MSQSVEPHARTDNNLSRQPSMLQRLQSIRTLEDFAGELQKQQSEMKVVLDTVYPDPEEVEEVRHGPVGYGGACTAVHAHV